MLLPSAISCDAAQPRLQPSLFASPPASPPTLSHLPGMPIGNIMASCRTLQGLMGGGSYDNSTSMNTTDELPGAGMYQLPTPPISYAPPPLKLRLRTPRGGKGEAAGSDGLTPRKKVVKRTVSGAAPDPAPRGANKRRRELDDDDADERRWRREASHSGDEEGGLDQRWESSEQGTPSPSTPKRARIAPEQLPLGLERSDFHNLELNKSSPQPQQQQESSSSPYFGVEDQEDGDGEWTAEDDRVLVELVLDKLKLSKTEWQDCARSLGRDKHAVGRRWKSLLVAGDVGIKGSRRAGGPRARLHSTWR